MAAENSCSAGKKKKMGRMYEVMKKVRLQSHEFGKFCNCKRLKCTENVSDFNRQLILDNFNALPSHNEQNAYLCSLISLVNVQKRRSRAKDKHEAKFHDSSYMYRVRIVRQDCTESKQNEANFEEIQVCAKFFLAVHGITGSKLQYLQSALKMTGTYPKDRRGGTNYKKLKPDALQAVHSHIQSFKSRKSHYSLHDNAGKTYLPEDLNIKKMFVMFQEKYPNLKVSYQTYREIFRKDYNIGFGYPRSDTCSQCDEFNSKIKTAEKANDHTELNKLKIQKELHLRKADTFYRRKTADRKKARSTVDFEAIAMDYQKNIPLPNITTNDVYYRRQLSMYTFNIHVLSSLKSYFYTYPEYIARKGSDEVCSFLFDFIMNYLPPEVQDLHIYCDGAGGQNKNYTVVRFIHYMVTVVKRLKSVTITFPVRGHSYLECDKNMGNINLKKRMETPLDWEENIANSRRKPSSFTVVSVNQETVKEWSEFFKTKYAKKCPFAMQKMKEVMCVHTHPRTVFHRDTYNGIMLEDPVRSFLQSKMTLPDGEFELPGQSYFEKIPISNEKYQDIVFLSKFCENEEAKKLYVSIPHENKAKEKTENQGKKVTVKQKERNKQQQSQQSKQNRSRKK